MFICIRTSNWGSFPGGLKNCLQCRRPGFDPWVRKILWRRKWQTTPVFLPGEFCGQRRLVGYSPWGRRVRHDWVTNTATTITTTSSNWSVGSANIIPSPYVMENFYSSLARPCLTNPCLASLNLSSPLPIPCLSPLFLSSHTFSSYPTTFLLVPHQTVLALWCTH